VKPAPFAFVRPQGFQHALEALAADEGAKVLAGGQSLVPLLNMRLAAPSCLVDILALEHVAHATIRNRGTVVGSLVHADAAAELPMVLALVGGRLRVASLTGSRDIAAAELFAGPMESTVRHDEIALEAFFPALAAGEGVAFTELARRHGDYAMCGVGAVVRVDGDRIVSARAGYLSVSEVPTVVELALEGADDASLAAAAGQALDRLDPVGDIHASADYRAHLVRVLTARVLRTAYDDARDRAGRAGSGP
jgi:2-furoyl-CoA dehydrogenase FAD binding subunit